MRLSLFRVPVAWFTARKMSYYKNDLFFYLSFEPQGNCFTEATATVASILATYRPIYSMDMFTCTQYTYTV